MDQLGLSLKCCLLCGEGTCGNDKQSKISKLEGIVGGVGCNLLERQLEKMFILLKVLEVPLNWCEGILLKSGGEDGGDNPDKWFTLCANCLEGNVKRAWNIYQKMLTWQNRMLSFRLQIREGMRRSILKSNQVESQVEGGGSSSQVDCAIKRYLFPELFTKMELLEAVLDETLISEMDFDNGDLDNDDNDNEDKLLYQNNLSVEVEPPKIEQKPYTGRKRGRPRKYAPSAAENDQLNLLETNFNYLENELKTLTDGDQHDTDYQPDKDMDFNVIEDANDSDSDYEPEKSPKRPNKFSGRPRGRPRIHPPRTTPIQNRRGRPRIHPPRPPPRHSKKGRPRLFASGTLKSKRFHWSICSTCDARYNNTEDYSAHMALHSQRDPSLKGPLDCTHCPFPARDPQELDYHLQRRHLQKTQPLKKTYSCPKCPFTTKRWKSLKVHVDIQHPTVPLNELGPDLYLKCPECDLQLQNMQKYQAHLHIEHPKDKDKGPVTCPSCGIKFLSQSLLNYHINSTHKKPLRHICDECGKGYEFANRLLRHKEAHLKKGDPLRKREHVCEECGLDFWEEATFKKHYRYMHGCGRRAPEKRAPVVYQCKYCDVKSGLRSFIKMHTLEAHKGEMAYQCDKCEKRYTNAQGLKRHLRLNHGDEEWPCPHCGKKFKGEDYMKDHVKRFCRLKGQLEKEMEAGTTMGDNTCEKIV